MTRKQVELLVTVLTATLFSVMNSSMVNVALPTLMHDFSIGIATSIWLYTGYTLPYAVTMPLLGILGERVGARTAFLWGVGGFLVASLLCSVAWNFPSLLVFRVLQALGAAAVIPNAMVLITAAFPPERRGQALGFWSASSGVGAGIGPALGGFLTQYASWHAIFWVNVPFLLLVIIAALRVIEPVETAGRHPRFDLLGALLLVVGLACLMLFLTEGRTRGWTQPLTLGFAVASVLGLTGFLVWELRTASPILPISLFRRWPYSAATTTVFIQAMVMFAILLLLPLYLQSARGHTPTEAGLMLLPMSALLILSAPVGGRLSDRLGPRLPATFGMFLFALSVGGLSQLSLTSPYWPLALLLALMGAGLGLSISPLTSTAMNAAEPSERGAASGFFNTVRFVGAVLGSTLFGVILSVQAEAAGGSHPGPAALMSGFHDVYLLGAGVVLIGVLSALTLRPGHETATAPASHAAAS